MRVTRRSPRTGELNSMELPMTPEQYAHWQASGEMIQNALPQLSAEQREFLLTGYTPDDWKILFPPEPDEA